MDEDNPREPSQSSYDHPIEKEALSKLDKLAIIEQFLAQTDELNTLRYHYETVQDEVATIKVDLDAYRKEIASLTNITQNFAAQISIPGPPPPNLIFINECTTIIQ